MIDPAAQVPATVLARPRRYVTLDGMRGVAAMIVILWHAASSIGPYDLRPRYGSLAVDLFFALSGFVLAYSYDRRFAAGMTAVDFMRKRLLRLYPLFIVGLALGVGLRAFPAIREASNTGGAMSGQDVVVSTIFNALMLPALDEARNHFLFPADLAGWSLFFEVWVANLGMALFWRQLQGRMLAAAIFCAAAAMLVALAAFHTVDIGYDWRTFAGGFPRVALSFLVGVALARFHAKRPPKLRVPSWLLLVTVVAALFVPLQGPLGHVYEVACAFLLFPVLIYLGAEAVEHRPSVGAALGDASYAAYTIHVPLLSAAALVAPGLAATPSEWSALAFVAVVFFISLALARFVDEPFRATVQRASTGRRSSSAAGA